MSLHPYSVGGPPSAASSVFDLPIGPRDSTPTDSRNADRLVEPLVPSTPPSSTRDPSSASYVVVSGGTGCNAICAAFGDDPTYILPVSDNGGSSSEIIRVLGGPSIGDIRSRLIRLMPPSHPDSPRERIRNLLSFRLPADATEREARDGWRDIVEGRSTLWDGIPADRKETIRGFLVHFDGEVLKRANKQFSFRNASIGNFFLTAAHLFFRSVPSAIFLFSSITGSQADILPVLVTNHTVTIAAELEDGNTLVGQCEISHPTSQSAIPNSAMSEVLIEQGGMWSPGIDALGEGPAANASNSTYTKASGTEFASLGSRIRRIYYINQYGQEIYPTPNPLFIKSLSEKKVIVYSCGSLYTSIIPCLALREVASAIASSQSLRAKVLLLNAMNDRETEGYTAVDYVRSIADSLRRHERPNATTRGNGLILSSQFPISAFITHVVYLRGTSIEVNESEFLSLGVQCVPVEVAPGEKLGFDAATVTQALSLILDSVNKEG